MLPSHNKNKTKLSQYLPVASSPADYLLSSNSLEPRYIVPDMPGTFVNKLLRKREPLHDGSVSGAMQESYSHSTYFDPMSAREGNVAPPTAAPTPASASEAKPEEYRPRVYTPEKRTYNFAAAPPPEELPAPVQRDMAQEARRSLDAAGIGGLLGMLFGGGRGAALGAIAASKGYSGGREQLAQEQQRQQDELVQQIQQRNARARQVWADEQARLERQMQLDGMEDERRNSIFQQEEKQRFFDFTQRKEKEEQERAEQDRIAALDQKLQASNLQLDARLGGTQRAFPSLDEEIRQVRASMARMPYQGRDRYGQPVTLYRKTSKLERAQLDLRLKNLLQQKGDLVGLSKAIQAQQGVNNRRIGTGR